MALSRKVSFFRSKSSPAVHEQVHKIVPELTAKEASAQRKQARPPASARTAHTATRH